MKSDEQKRRAAVAALGYIKDGITLGVGTGSTVDLFIDELPAHAHRLTSVVSSSNRSTEKLERLGIEVVSLSEVGDIDLYVDGADEATKHLHLIKGGGGALTREKVLAGASRRFVCIVDSSKLVGHLGAFPLPVEVVPMARSFVARQMIRAGGQPIWRQDFVTDNGNEILDVHNLRIANPVEMETRFNQIPGVVTVGIFAHRSADVLLVGDDTGVRVLE
ncbi:MAG: ribose-5-phosphate isomerase RpiA [Gammaproteobacteria bacterium]|nr:ribose-5-phosphate isomerase RpiA [Gammaproteobacteria bacterium]